MEQPDFFVGDRILWPVSPSMMPAPPIQTVIVAPRHMHPVLLTPFSDQSKLVLKPIRDGLLGQLLRDHPIGHTMPSLVGLPPSRAGGREVCLDEDRPSSSP